MASDRVTKIRRKYGITSFRTWGKRGGSPVLKAWVQGRIPHHLVKTKKG